RVVVDGFLEADRGLLVVALLIEPDPFGVEGLAIDVVASGREQQAGRDPSHGRTVHDWGLVSPVWLKIRPICGNRPAATPARPYADKGHQVSGAGDVSRGRRPQQGHWRRRASSLGCSEGCEHEEWDADLQDRAGWSGSELWAAHP